LILKFKFEIWSGNLILKFDPEIWRYKICTQFSTNKTATWRSYKSRILFFKKLRSDALILLNQLISEKKRNQLDYAKLDQISSVIVFTSKESWEDDLIAGYVHLVSTEINFKFHSKSNISTSYLLLEILR